MCHKALAIISPHYYKENNSTYSIMSHITPSVKTPCASSRSWMVDAWCKLFSATWARGRSRLPENLHRALRDPTPTNRVTTWTRCPITRTRSRTETPPPRCQAGMAEGACPPPLSAWARIRLRLLAANSSRPAYPSCLNSIAQGQDHPRKRQKLPVDIPAPPCQYRAMLGETQNPILPHPRSAQYMRERKMQISISSVSGSTRSGLDE